MEITEKSVSFNIGSYVSSVREKQKADASPDAAHHQGAKEDKVQLSAKAREILEAKKSLNAISDVRDEKVAEIRNNIEKGTYQVNGEKIASKMIEETFTNQAALKVDVKA